MPQTGARHQYSKGFTVLCCAVLCCVVLCCAVLCSALPCCAVLCSAVQCIVVQCSAVQCSAVQCSAVQCSAVQCSAVQCSAVQCSAVQCSAVQCSAMLCWARNKFCAVTFFRNFWIRFTTSRATPSDSKDWSGVTSNRISTLGEKYILNISLTDTNPCIVDYRWWFR